MRSPWGRYHLPSCRHGRAVWRALFSVRWPPRRQLLKKALAIQWPRSSSSIAIFASLIRETASDFISDGFPPWSTHPWLCSWKVLEHCGHRHRQTQAVQDIEQGGQHRDTTGLMQNAQLNGHVEHQGGDAQEPRAHFGVLGVPLRSQDAPLEAPLGALGVPLLRGEGHDLAIQFLCFLWSFMACHARDRYSTQYLVATGKERSSQTNLWECFFQKHWLARAKPYNVPFEETCPNQNSEKTVGNTW